jgi:serine/threonine protein kinase
VWFTRPRTQNLGGGLSRSSFCRTMWPEIRKPWNAFGHEARAASALSHPNICTIYEIGKSGELSFIAMEFLDGEALKHRIARRPMDRGPVLALLIEIADGLNAVGSK